MTSGAVAIVLAAGRGERLGAAEPKALRELGDKPMVVRAVEAALASASIDAVVVAVPLGSEEQTSMLLRRLGPSTVVTGGATRQASVGAALEEIPGSVPVIVCHDAARPFASPALFDAVVAGLDRFDGVVPVVRVPDTVKRLEGDAVSGTVPREELGLAQTPQAFRSAALRDAHVRAAEAGLEFTDDAAAVEWAGYRVRAVPGEPGNFKITTAEDLARAEAALG